MLHPILSAILQLSPNRKASDLLAWFRVPSVTRPCFLLAPTSSSPLRTAKGQEWSYSSLRYHGPIRSSTARTRFKQVKHQQDRAVCSSNSDILIKQTKSEAHSVGSGWQTGRGRAGFIPYPGVSAVSFIPCTQYSASFSSSRCPPKADLRFVDAGAIHTSIDMTGLPTLQRAY